MSEQRLLDMWLPPDGAGEPVACLATSFTFDTDFFRDDCLSRFLGLRGSIGEEAGGLLAQIGELEEALADVQVSVIIDRSARVEGRNLRWDVLPGSNPGGLLHTKTALLMWRNLTRVIIGSANLTPAGYRYQREIAVAFDITTEADLPRKFWDDYNTALLEILALTPDDLVTPGPKARATDVMGLLQERLNLADFPREAKTASVHLIYSHPGRSVTEQVHGLLRTPRPRFLRAMSPFWDKEDQGSSDAVRALTSLLNGKGSVEAKLLVPLEAGPDGTVANAPENLRARTPRPAVEVSMAGITDGQTETSREHRRLHAKAFCLESEDYRLTVIGSSNMTSSGLGLHSSRGHYEMNVAYLIPARGRLARNLESIFPATTPIDETVTFNVLPDIEDEPSQPPLPSGFQAAMIERIGDQWFVLMAFDIAQLPDSWLVKFGSDVTPAITSASFRGHQHERMLLTSAVLPQSLIVEWTDKNGDARVADWVLNVANPADLPLDERLRAIPIDLIIDVLAQGSRNPTAALERLLEKLSNMDNDSTYEDLGSLDPLRSFDDSRALLRRIQTYSRALDQLADRLARPAPTVSALGWRLTGLVSPTRLAEGWLEQAESGDLPAEMAHFLLAELLLVMNRTDWRSVTEGLNPGQSGAALQEMRDRVSAAMSQLPPLDAGNPLVSYVESVRSIA